MKSIVRIVVPMFFLFVIEACAPALRFTSQKIKDVVPSAPEENLDRYENYPALETVTGIASFYADKYHGRITYGGEVYDMNGISAAHPSYSMNTIVRITNLTNNKNVILRINDKMPLHPERIIDLSLGAAQKLDFVKQGLAEVKIEVLEWGDGRN